MVHSSLDLPQFVELIDLGLLLHLVVDRLQKVVFLLLQRLLPLELLALQLLQPSLRQDLLLQELLLLDTQELDGLV